MQVSWFSHHFVSRNPALDFANTVVYRHAPHRREDRLRSAAAINSWVRAGDLDLAAVSATRVAPALRLRELIDELFRLAATTGTIDGPLWSQLIRLYARHLAPRASPKSSPKRPNRNRPFLSAMAEHAIRLALSPDLLRVKVCPGCGWLFIDRTRNGSKRWCISALCGNRDKARRFYERRHKRKSTSESLSAPSSRL